MNKTILLGLLLAASYSGSSRMPVHAQSGNEGAECGRHIATLQGSAPAESYEALQKMQVYRQEGQYRACIDAGQLAQERSSTRAQLQAERVRGMDVFNEKGEQVGNINQLARGDDQKIYVLMTYRGPRWPGDKQVAVPIEQMTMHEGRLLLPGIGEKEILAMPAVPQDGGAYRSLEGAEAVRLP